MSSESRPHELRHLEVYMEEISQYDERKAAMLQQAVRLLRLRHHDSGGPFSPEARDAVSMVLREGPGKVDDLILSLAAVGEILLLIRKKEVGKGGGDSVVEIRDMIPRQDQPGT